MSMRPFQGKCWTCGHNHDADNRVLQDILSNTPAPDIVTATMGEVCDPFADIRGKRMSELNGEQTDRAFELWLRDNAMSFGRYYAEGDSALFPRIFRVIDRLRADAADIADQLAEISESKAIFRLSNRYRPALQSRFKGMIKRLRHG